MALSTKVGSFAAPAAAGNLAVTGVGFQPKFVLFWGNLLTADGSSATAGTASNMPSTVLGMTDGTGNAVFGDSDDFTGGDTFVDIAACYRISRRETSTPISATIVSLDSDGFTLHFAGTNSGSIINYLAVGGTDITGAKLATYSGANFPSTTGSKSFTGAGFQPDAAIILAGNIMGNDGTSGQAHGGLGFMSGTAAEVAYSTSFAVSSSDEYQRTNQATVGIKGSTKVWEAALTSFDADGLTLNVTTRGTITSPVMAILYLKGAQFKAGSFTQKTSTGTQATTGIGFQPSALLVSSSMKTSGTTLTANGVNVMTGAGDGTSEGVFSTTSNGSADWTLDRTKILKVQQDNSSPGTLAAAALSSLDTDGFTLNYTTADATAREFLFFAIGPAATGGSALTQNVDDSVTMSDATAFGPGLGLADSVTMSDAVAFSPGLGLADSVTMSESVSLGPGLSLSDSVTPADAISLGPGLGLSDSVTMSDALSMGVGLGLADTLVLADALAMGLGLSLADAVTLADSVNEQLNGGGVALTQNIDDTVTLADALAFGIGLEIDDNVALADALAFGLGLGLADAVALADAISKSPGLSLADGVTMADSTSFGIGLGVNDAIPLVDALMLSAGLSLNDALTLADHVSFLLNGQPFPQTVKAHVRSYFITKFGFYT